MQKRTRTYRNLKVIIKSLCWEQYGETKTRIQRKTKGISDFFPKVMFYVDRSKLIWVLKGEH